MRLATVVRIAAALASMGGAALAGCGHGGPAGRPPPAPPKVTVAHPELREIVDYDEFSGWLAAPETVEVRARVDGHIEKVNFTDGDFVKAGDLLFTLDKRPIEANLERARDQVKVFEAQIVFQEKEVARQRELIEKGGTSRAQMETAEAQLGTLRAQIGAAEQDVARLALDAEYAEIRAPIAGRASRALVTTGNYVVGLGGGAILTTIVKMDPIYVSFYADERTVLERREARLRADPEAARKTIRELEIPLEFGLESEDGYPHGATLDFVDNRIDPKTGTILARATVPNSNLLFLPGARVRVRVPVSAQPYKALLIPDTAVLTDQDRRYVLVVGPGAVVVRRDLKLGRLRDDGKRVVLPGAGLGEDDLIIVLGLQMARVNYPVEPFDADGKPVSVPPAPSK
jgi:multidrug efflux system membrane fusion protein